MRIVEKTIDGLLKEFKTNSFFYTMIVRNLECFEVKKAMIKTSSFSLLINFDKNQ